jgi:Tfp pilus assembly protein PilF
VRYKSHNRNRKKPAEGGAELLTISALKPQSLQKSRRPAKMTRLRYKGVKSCFFSKILEHVVLSAARNPCISFRFIRQVFFAALRMTDSLGCGREVAPRFPLFLVILAGTIVLGGSTMAHARRDSGLGNGDSGRPNHESRAPNPEATASQLQTYRSLGKAYYEQGEYQQALQQFEKVVGSGRAVAMDHLDFGQALIQANKLNDALEELTTAKQMAPHLLSVDYNLGLVYKHELHYPQAEAELKRVAAADPGDPPTWFNLGEVYFAEHRLQPALTAFERVVNMGYAKAQNFYVAATFHCFIILTRLRQPAEARKYLKLNMATRDKVPGISLQYPALEAGKYGEVRIAPPQAMAAVGPPSKEMVFENVTSKLGIKARPPLPNPRQRGAIGIEHGPAYAMVHVSGLVPHVQAGLVPRPVYAPDLFGPSFAFGDYTGSSVPDVYVTGSSAIGGSYLLRNSGNGTFTDVTKQAGVAGPDGSLAAEFVDYNNSGHPSLVIAGLGGLTLYKSNGNGTFTDITRQAGLKGDLCELDTDVKAVDTDNDGLLDLVVTGYTNLCKPAHGSKALFPDSYPRAAPHLYHNNGDGTFTDVTASSGLEAARGHFRQVVFADFTNSGYMDLLFLRDDGPPMLFLNHGDDRFIDGTKEAGPALADSRADEAAVSDFNHDGKFDLALWGTSGYDVLLNRGNARFEAVPNLPAIKPLNKLFARHGAVADLDGNSFDDILVKDQDEHWHAVLNYGGRFKEVPLRFVPGLSRGVAGGAYPLPPYFGWETCFTPAWLTRPGNLDLLTFDPFVGRPMVLQRQGSSPHWIEVRLLGYKSNQQGVGDVIELKAGNFYDKVLARQGTPVRVFTGDVAKVDVVRVTWPNQVVENNVNVSTDTAIDVKESSRLASSCPFLYVWNGRRFVFYTDIMGVSPLGELAPDGATVEPNPRQLVRLGSSLRAINGNYVFQLTDEMREVDYFDQLRLLAVDHPASEEVYADEIYSPTPARPRMYFVRHKRFPVSAVDDQGKSVLPLIRYEDGRYPTDFHRDRILGLAAPHSLTLDLGPFSQSARVALWLRGWVFWTDSNASRALETNHRLRMIDPYLQVRDRSGRWVTAIPDIGLPAGTDRAMRVDLTGKFPTSDHHVRIVTSLCVYWDQIFFTTGGPPAMASFELPLASANLHYRGFSEVKSDPAHLVPDFFDYARLMTFAPWDPASGLYTQYGPVRNLLSKADDQLVTMGSGDELTVKFSARSLPPLRPGWKRDFFLYAVGYAKDGEPNTEFSRTVAPMPFLAMPNYPPQVPGPSGASYKLYLRKYENRPGYKLIPPLAPTGQ